MFMFHTVNAISEHLGFFENLSARCRGDLFLIGIWRSQPDHKWILKKGLNTFNGSCGLKVGNVGWCYADFYCQLWLMPARNQVKLVTLT